ncbi:hypothetical protein [Pontibacter sp. G13]|uniref:hypothetical protein n=1 Tax=Pontibacter sp. G13 TaxID=3074898 RepID=UPI00288BC691|nr:hypothetical protein [Pontibacter sp. G13]WNJ18632.1 hypothetical protein RJD25_27565 [Pontibacter sp. G13]
MMYFLASAIVLYVSRQMFFTGPSWEDRQNRIEGEKPVYAKASGSLKERNELYASLLRKAGLKKILKGSDTEITRNMKLSAGALFADSKPAWIDITLKIDRKNKRFQIFLAFEDRKPLNACFFYYYEYEDLWIKRGGFKIDMPDS